MTTELDFTLLRKDFPILDQQVNGHPLVYLDSAATTQKPQAVIDAVAAYYQNDNANVHRGAHALSDRATQDFENARTKVATFINSPKREQIIWTRGTTESINLVAQSYVRSMVTTGDVILVSALEHHSNIVPWQIVCEQTGAELRVIPVNAAGEIELDEYYAMLNESVKFVSVNHVSNALGSINPVKEIIDAAHKIGAKVMIDGAQAVPHFAIDVQTLDCDFYAFSGHKLFAPTGIGVLYGKEQLLEQMQPYQAGGEMIEVVSFNGTSYNKLPYKFEAGTPNIAGAIGLGAAIDYLNQLDRPALLAYEDRLLAMATEKAKAIGGITLVGTAKNKTGVMSFLLDGAHPHDVGTLLDQQGIAVRTGHHCAMPIMQQFKIPGTIRASFSFYNNESDVKRLFTALEKAKSFLI
ncbi:aminotransferase class V-fold PLP-dependent enzyme [Pleionea litopenaei]|uniref:Cysteine desulfurase n=1 Tax=Pleionea litopenaei TaxID=3070815 RepID=A0AA51RU01_9GAMM|nr:cysteine desulfurase [Pleionea sp. HL-JVS1]WMS87601.1 cysteine desulfurase [Pleionea sp. HL-JVS1]